MGDCEWWVKNRTGVSGSIIIRVDKNSLQVEEYMEDKYFLSLKIKRKKDNWCEVIIVVYGPNDSCLHSQIWTKLKQIHRRRNEPQVIGGDFNVV